MWSQILIILGMVCVPWGRLPNFSDPQFCPLKRGIITYFSDSCDVVGLEVVLVQIIANIYKVFMCVRHFSTCFMFLMTFNLL